MAHTKFDARKWMYSNADDYADACESSALDCTKLAEDCANALDLYEPDDAFTIPEWLFEMAVDVETVRAEGIAEANSTDARRELEEMD